MAIEDLLKPKSMVSFDVYPVAILGTGYVNATVLGIIDGSTAQALGFDPEQMHVNVYPTLPPGTPNHFSDYLYVRIRLENNTTTVVGLPWIKEETITLVQFGTLYVTIGNTGPEDQARVVKALAGIGLTASDIRYI